MSGNQYLKIARLATHPAFSHRQTALVCPLCENFTTLRAGEYDRHFLAHDPSQGQAYRWLSGRTYDRIATKRGWPDTAQQVAKAAAAGRSA